MGDLLHVLARMLLRFAIVVGVLTLALALHSCTTGHPAPRVPEALADLPPLSAPPLLRIKLTAQTHAASILLAVEGPYEIRRLGAADVLSRGDRLPATSLSARADGCLLGALPLHAAEIECLPANDGTVQVGDRKYRGSIILLGGSDGISAENRIDLESYLAGVLGSEAPLDWPDAALEAQCVAARTYALWQTRTARTRDNGGPDLADDVSSQVYLGMKNETGRSRAIVAATRGAVCIYNGRLFPTFYSNTCGGHTEPARLVLPKDQPPEVAPLAGRPCEFCGASPYAAWEATFSRGEIAKALFGPAGTGDAATSVRVVDAGPGGHAVTIGVSTEKHPAERVISSLEFRLALDARKLKSTRFEMTPASGNIRFNGSGWGHAAGLCQMGAFTMAGSGFDSLAILRYYYPGADVVRLYD